MDVKKIQMKILELNEECDTCTDLAMNMLI
jgi:hypothetical protein